MCNNRESERADRSHDAKCARPMLEFAGRRSVADLADAVPTDLLLEQKRSLEQLNTWFEVALNNMVRGLSMFDADQRLIVCNKSYRQMYSLPEELTRPGTPLTEIVRYHVLHETGRDGAIEEAKFSKWLEDHVAKLAEGRSFSQVQHLRSGRYAPRHLSAAGRRRLGRYSRGHHREAAHRGEDRVAGAPRCADRRRQPLLLPRDVRACPQGPRQGQLAGAALDRPRRVQGGQRHATAIPIGDALLKAVAQRLRTSIRKTDFLARLGGDEFAIIQTGAVRTDQCERLAKRVLASISKPYNILGHTITISASLGIVRAPAHGRTADELLKNADVALYNVKSAGRRGFEIYRRGCGRQVDAQRRLESDIHTALSQRSVRAALPADPQPAHASRRRAARRCCAGGIRATE